jgi:toluene monooxygenase system protein E
MAIRSNAVALKKRAVSRARETSKLKAYSHLSGQRRVPTDYEIVTSGLLYYQQRGFEVNVPLATFYRQHQAESRLRLADGERFADPQETTYAKYVARAAEGEAYVEGIFRSMEESRYDEQLAPDWKRALAGVLGAMRFPVHGFQMLSAYVGQMAPSGKIAVCALFQAADEVRRVHRVAYRLVQLVGDSDPVSYGKDAWQRDAAWQPLRELVERSLVVFDWAEALAVLNLCIKPIFDELLVVHVAALAKERGDYHLAELYGAITANVRWHQEWSLALFDLAFREEPSNRDVVRSWTAAWQPRALAAGRALESVLPGAATVAERAAASIAQRFDALAGETTP